MTSRERVIRAIEFRNPDRIPFCSMIPGFTDLFIMPVMPARDWQPDEGFYPNMHPVLYFAGNWRFKKHFPLDVQNTQYARQDEFGCVWTCEGEGNIGQVTGHPLKTWDGLENLKLPNPNAPGRFAAFELYRRMFARKTFVLGMMENGIFERSHFLRGFEQLMMDFVESPEMVERLADRLIDEWMIPLIKRMAKFGCDGVAFCDDWGTQTALMISPRMWRKIYKPRYERMFRAAHALGLKVFMHSCGFIRDILPDLIEIGLDVLQKDDCSFMGLEELGDLIGGKLCVMGSVDIQRTMPGASDDVLIEETKRMMRVLSTDSGGLIGAYYSQPNAVGISWKQMLLMHSVFILNGSYPLKV